MGGCYGWGQQHSLLKSNRILPSYIFWRDQREALESTPHVILIMIQLKLKGANFYPTLFLCTPSIMNHSSRSIFGTGGWPLMITLESVLDAWEVVPPTSLPMTTDTCIRTSRGTDALLHGETTEPASGKKKFLVPAWTWLGIHRNTPNHVIWLWSPMKFHVLQERPKQSVMLSISLRAFHKKTRVTLNNLMKQTNNEAPCVRPSLNESYFLTHNNFMYHALCSSICYCFLCKTQNLFNSINQLDEHKLSVKP